VKRASQFLVPEQRATDSANRNTVRTDYRAQGAAKHGKKYINVFIDEELHLEVRPRMMLRKLTWGTLIEDLLQNWFEKEFRSFTPEARSTAQADRLSHDVHQSIMSAGCKREFRRTHHLELRNGCPPYLVACLRSKGANELSLCSAVAVTKWMNSVQLAQIKGSTLCELVCP